MTKYLLLLLLALVGLTQPARAQRGHGYDQVCGLTLYTQDGEKFRLYCNGNLVTPQPTTRAKVRELDTDVVRVRVVFAKPALGTIEKTMYLRMGDEERHVVKRRDERDRTETTGASLEAKLLGALGQDTKEKGTSPYTIVFNNSVPYVPDVEAHIDVEKTTTVSAGGHTVKTHTRAKVRTTAH